MHTKQTPIHSKQKPTIVQTMGESRSYMRETTTPLHKRERERERNSYKGEFRHVFLEAILSVRGLKLLFRAFTIRELKNLGHIW